MSYIGRGIDQIDNISTLDNLSFNGSSATFNLTQNSVAFVPVSADALQIQIDGVIQSNNYTVSGSTVTFDFTPSGSSVCNGIRHFGVGLLTQPSTGSVGINELSASGTKDATTFLRGDNTFATVSGTTINNNADNRVITGSGTANTLNGEANLTYDGSTLTVKPGSNVHQLKLEQNNATDYWSLHADSSGGPLSFQRYTGGAETEKMRIDTSGKVLIGTPTTTGTADGLNDLIVGNTSSGSHGISIQTPNNQTGYLAFADDSTSPNPCFISYDHAGGYQRFWVNGAERMRIDSSGDLLVNCTSLPSASVKGFGIDRKGTIGMIVTSSSATGGDSHMQMFNPNGQVGSIVTSGSSTAFNTSSDYRLKENVVDMTDATTRLKQLQPKRFNFIADADTTVDGFIAHEVSSIVPEAISGEKDAMAVETTYTADDVETQGDSPSKNVGDPKTYSTTEIDAQGIDQSKLVPLLTSALQEAITKIETLEARVQTLENA